jgi:TetR/AcrR family transcriptional regulator, transcriptional repressor for nem operon
MGVTTSQKRNEILQHARELLRKRGFNAFSHRELADLVGVKSSSVHYYFPSKEDVGIALIQGYRTEVMSSLESLPSVAAEERIDGFVDLFVRSASSGEDWCPAAMLASDFMTLGRTLQDEVRGFFNLVEKWLEKQITEFNAAMASEEASALAKTGMAMLEGALLLSRSQHDPARVRQAGNAFKQLLLIKNP